MEEARTVVDWLLRAGLLGALVAWARGTWTAWRQRKAERRSLLRLVEMEVQHNEAVLEARSPSDYGNVTNVLRTDTWEQTRVRLAQVLKDRQFSQISDYYRDAQRLNHLWSPDAHPSHRAKEATSAQARLTERGKEITAWIRDELNGS